MNKYRVVAVTALSIVAGLLIAMIVGPACAGDKPKKKARKVQAAVTAKANPVVHEPVVRAYSQELGWMKPRPLNTQPGPCNWFSFEHSLEPDSYSQASDTAYTYWNLDCDHGNSDGCPWSYKALLYAGTYSEDNPPEGNLVYQSGCRGSLDFVCGFSDTAYTISLSNIKANYGTSAIGYTLLVILYENDSCSGEPTLIDYFNFSPQ